MSNEYDFFEQSLKETIMETYKSTFILEIFTITLGDDICVNINKENIYREINQAESETTSIRGMKVYLPITQSSTDFIKMVNECNRQGDVDDETFLYTISLLNNVLIDLYNDVLKKVDIQLNDIDDWRKYLDWLSFWSSLFYDEDLFREKYSSDIFEDLPELWRFIINMVDVFLENEEWNPVFSSIVQETAENILECYKELETIFREFKFENIFDVNYLNNVGEVLEFTNNQVKKLLDALDRVTDFLPGWGR